MTPEPPPRYRYLTFNTQRPPQDGLSLPEINQRLRDMAALAD